ncbi:MAG: N-terminal domain [Bacteroidota bacterium]
MQPKLSKKMDLSQSETFADFVREVKTEIRAAQYRALQKVNREMIGLYWLLGKLIAERQQK